ncbi:MAG: hypothetical protein WCH65_00985 [bacterium]
MTYCMLPNFAVICPNVDAHFSILTPTNPARIAAAIPRENFLCFLIRWIFTSANHIIHQIYAVLDSVRSIASNRSSIIPIFTIVCLFALTTSLIVVNFCLHSVSMKGRNAIKKYP